jgi:Agglutinin C-terminal
MTIDLLALQGVSILIGVMFGTNTSGAGHAYNWYVTEGNLGNIVFFE